MNTPTATPLSEQAIAALRDRAQLPAYDRSKIEIGIVHFGPGAFHRGHQACYIDTILKNDPRWGICGAELRGLGLQAQLTSQDNLYVVAELDIRPTFRIVGSLKEYFTAERNPDAIFARLINPAVKLVSMTVTEKGYCLDNMGSLDFRNPDVCHDLDNPNSPRSLIGWLLRALKERKDAHIRPFMPLSCDNVSGNGRKLRHAVLELADALYGQEIRTWIEEEVFFPSTMVDSITPATTDELKQRIRDTLGVCDEAPVNRESFQQWVIEDILGNEAPDLAAAGAILTSDIEAFENAKLRLLNAAHSTLAYAGALLGYRSVGAAMQDKSLAVFVERMMREDISPTLRQPAGLDLNDYITTILHRFRNPALTHHLLQIAADGSQKLPIRILPTISEMLITGRSLANMTLPIAAWLHFVVREAKQDHPLIDPLAASLAIIGKACTGDAHHDVCGFLNLSDVFSVELANNEKFVEALTFAYDAIGKGAFDGITFGHRA